MRHRTTLALTCLIICLIAAPMLSGQALSGASPASCKRNPDGWFTLSVPKEMSEVKRYADVDGGFYLSSDLELNFDYWTYESTPNWLRGKYATNLILACTGKGKRTRTWRTRIDGKPGVIQHCSLSNDPNGFRYFYYVTFPKLRVFDGEDFHFGKFNLGIKYRTRSQFSIVRRIVRSLNFER